MQKRAKRKGGYKMDKNTELYYTAIPKRGEYHNSGACVVAWQVFNFDNMSDELKDLLDSCTSEDWLEIPEEFLDLTDRENFVVKVKLIPEGMGTMRKRISELLQKDEGEIVINEMFKLCWRQVRRDESAPQGMLTIETIRRHEPKMASVEIHSREYSAIKQEVGKVMIDMLQSYQRRLIQHWTNQEDFWKA